jgi:O-succinylbenzoic acid--CoA ligase
VSGAPSPGVSVTLEAVSTPPDGSPVRRLRPVPVGVGPEVLTGFLPALRAALNGSGDAVLPHATDRAPPAALRPGEPLGAHEDDAHDPTVAVVTTSGSSGTPKGVLLSASALLASASATHDRLGGPGRWLLALPAQHVAGVQVLVRSLLTGTEPGVLDLAAGFTPAGFAAAARELRGVRRYTALVPTQLVRLLDGDGNDGHGVSGGDGLAELARFDGVLVGGAGTPEPVLERARAAGVRLVTTYGASETSGGCVYDGVPLEGVGVRLEDGRILLGGATLARGYRGGDPDGVFVRDADGTRWWRTADAGRWDGAHDGRRRLRVLGRIDEAVLTGGMTVLPAAVEAALLRMPGVADAVVTGVDDPEWGQRVVAAVVAAPGAGAPRLADVRAHVAAALGPYAAPRQVLVLDALPMVGIGKPDRAAVARLAAAG